MNENNELTAAQIKGKRNLYLFASAVGLLVLGLIYAWSIFSGPLAAFTGYAKGDLQVTFTFSMVFFCLGCLAGAFINKKLSVRGTLLVAAALLAVGFAGTVLLGQASIYYIYVCYGVLCATACGIGYNTIIATVGVWFPDRTGFASGVMMMGFGLGSLILGSIVAKMIDPQDPQAIGIQKTFYILAAVGFVVTAAIAALIRTAPPNIVKEMAPQRLAAGNVDKPAIADDYVYKAPIFWVYVVFGMCAIAAGVTLIGSAKPGLEKVGGAVGVITPTLFVGLFSTLNGVSRVIVGTIYDKTSLKVAFFAIVVAGLLASSGLAGAYSTSMPLLYIVAGLLMGFSYGGIPVVAAAFAREGFGARLYPTNLATVNLTIALGAFLSQAVISMTNPKNPANPESGTAADLSVWLGIIAVSAVAFLAIAAFSMMYKKK
ncbi:MAG: MFS transporter [Acidobacteriota bacterium]|nr:MFS transporter [Acidobacteriota bacterium]